MAHFVFAVHIGGSCVNSQCKLPNLPGMPSTTKCRAKDRIGKPYSPPEIDRIWLWVCYKKIPKYPIFYLLKGDYKL